MKKNNGRIKDINDFNFQDFVTFFREETEYSICKIFLDVESIIFQFTKSYLNKSETEVMCDVCLDVKFDAEEEISFSSLLEKLKIKENEINEWSETESLEYEEDEEDMDIGISLEDGKSKKTSNKKNNSKLNLQAECPYVVEGGKCYMKSMKKCEFVDSEKSCNLYIRYERSLPPKKENN